MRKKFKILLLIIFIPLFSYFFASIRVSKSLKKDDLDIVKLLNIENECTNVNSYKKEIKCIKSVQKAQLNLIKGTTCRGKYINMGSKEVITSNTACCYDRARITEQALQNYGFKVRHIHLNQTQKIGFLNLFVPGTPSHASTEVLTSKGWLGVDSNEPFLLLDINNLPYSFKEGITNGLINNLSKKPSFYNKPLTYIIGLYSRNGTFLEPYLPFVPEINIIDFFGNLLEIAIVNPKVIESQNQ